MAIDDELEEMLRAAEASGQAVACDASVFLYRSGRWAALMDHARNGSWRHLTFLPRQEVIKRARRGKPRLAMAPLEFADRLLGTPEEYLALFRSGQVRLYGGVTSDNVFSPDTEAEFLRLTTYMMAKGTGQYWLQFAG
jgi:hypothetical protein